MTNKQIEDALIMIADQIFTLSENQCENFGQIWLDKYKEFTTIDHLEQKTECDCRVEYDDQHIPVEMLCKLHREEENERLKNEYQWEEKKEIIREVVDDLHIISSGIIPSGVGADYYTETRKRSDISITKLKSLL